MLYSSDVPELHTVQYTCPCQFNLSYCLQIRLSLLLGCRVPPSFFLLTELFTETLQARWIIEKTAERKTCQSKEGRSGEIKNPVTSFPCLFSEGDYNLSQWCGSNISLSVLVRCHNLFCLSHCWLMLTENHTVSSLFFCAQRAQWHSSTVKAYCFTWLPPW